MDRTNLIAVMSDREIGRLNHRLQSAIAALNVANGMAIVASDATATREQEIRVSEGLIEIEALISDTMDRASRKVAA